MGCTIIRQVDNTTSSRVVSQAKAIGNGAESVKACPSLAITEWANVRRGAVTITVQAAIILSLSTTRQRWANIAGDGVTNARLSRLLEIHGSGTVLPAAFTIIPAAVAIP